MISIVCGKKGSGKTRKLLEMANNSVETAKGEIVFIDLKIKYTQELDRNIRLINVKEFSINNSENFLGFLNGLIAGNYDIDEVYVDNALKIMDINLQDLEPFFDNLKEIGEKFQVNFIFAANCEEDIVPHFMNAYTIIRV